MKVAIRDHGKGIPPHLIKQVLRGSETFGKLSGNGLGLSHARRSVEEWGESIAIRSQVGEGTIVTIEMPRYYSSEAPRGAGYSKQKLDL